MEAGSTSETSVNLYETTWRNNPEDKHLWDSPLWEREVSQLSVNFRRIKRLRLFPPPTYCNDISYLFCHSPADYVPNPKHFNATHSCWTYGTQKLQTVDRRRRILIDVCDISPFFSPNAVKVSWNTLSPSLRLSQIDKALIKRTGNKQTLKCVKHSLTVTLTGHCHSRNKVR
jgi:hypothetical protein